jgi:hypothetical protein
MTERWFLMTEFKAELGKPQPAPTEPEFIPPTSKEMDLLGLRYTLDNMIYDVIEELEYAMKSGAFDRDTAAVLSKMRRRVREVGRICRELACPLVPMPKVAEMPRTVQ